MKKDLHVYLYGHLLIISPFKLVKGDIFLVNNPNDISVLKSDGTLLPIPENNIYYKAPFTHMYLKHTEFDNTYHVITFPKGIGSLAEISKKNAEIDNMSYGPYIYLTEEQFDNEKVAASYQGQKYRKRETGLPTPIGYIKISRLYKFAYHNIEPSIEILDSKCFTGVSAYNVKTWYDCISFIIRDGKEVPITSNGLLTTKIRDYQDEMYYISPEFPHIIIHSKGHTKPFEKIRKFNYTIVNKTAITEEIETDMFGPKIKIIGQYIAGQGTIVRNNVDNTYTNIIFSGNNYNLNGIDLVYLLASAILPGRTSSKPYLLNHGGIKDLRELYWVDSPNTLDL